MVPQQLPQAYTLDNLGTSLIAQYCRIWFSTEATQIMNERSKIQTFIALRKEPNLRHYCLLVAFSVPTATDIQRGFSWSY